jgi:hypothetical protein
VELDDDVAVGLDDALEDELAELVAVWVTSPTAGAAEALDDDEAVELDDDVAEVLTDDVAVELDDALEDELAELVADEVCVGGEHFPFAHTLHAPKVTHAQSS